MTALCYTSAAPFPVWGNSHVNISYSYVVKISVSMLSFSPVFSVHWNVFLILYTSFIIINGTCNGLLVRFPLCPALADHFLGPSFWCIPVALLFHSSSVNHHLVLFRVVGVAGAIPAVIRREAGAHLAHHSPAHHRHTHAIYYFVLFCPQSMFSVLVRILFGWEGLVLHQWICWYRDMTVQYVSRNCP